MSSSLEPTPEQFAALAARPADTPVVMVNLLKFRADGGSESYVRYAQEVVPHLQRVGGTSCMRAARRRGHRRRRTAWWDAILVVEYPSPAAFIDMVTDEEYLKVHEHRAAGLDRGDLIATSTSWTRSAGLGHVPGHRCRRRGRQRQPLGRRDCCATTASRACDGASRRRPGRTTSRPRRRGRRRRSDRRRWTSPTRCAASTGCSST